MTKPRRIRSFGKGSADPLPTSPGAWNGGTEEHTTIHGRKRCTFKADAFDVDQMIFEGYASAYGNLDSGGDIVEPGAFAEFLESGWDRVLIMFNHDEDALPIGKPLELREDKRGLYIKARIVDTTQGADVWKLIKAGALNELSIGYGAPPGGYDYDAKGIRHLRKLSLDEVSVVSKAMNEQATITSYKSKNGKGAARTMTMDTKSAFTLDDLKGVVKEAVTEGMAGNNTDPDEQDPPIKTAFMSALGKRAKELGEPEEGIEALADELVAIATQLAEEADSKSDDPREPEEPTEDHVKNEEQDVFDKRKGKAAPAPARQSKSYAHTQRQYASIYTPQPPAATGETKRLPPDVRLARAIKCYNVFGKNDPDRAAHAAKAYYGDETLARELKALNVTSPTAGGFLVPEQFVADIIELLYAKTVVYELGAQTVPMPGGNLCMPKMTSGARAKWEGELRPSKSSQPGFGMIKLSAKKLKAVVPISRELMMTSSFSADQMFARDLMNQMRLGLDYGVLFGSGGEFQPLGLVNTKGVQVIDIDKPATVKGGWLDAAGKITPDFINELYGLLMQKNVNGNKLGWAFPPMLMVQIGNMKTTTGAYIYRDEMNRGTLLGFPFKTTTQIPLTGSIADDTGKTSIIFGDWADVIIGEMSGMQTETTTEGTWEDENGGQHNAFNEDAAATKALMYVDSALRYTESFIHVKNVPV